MTEGDNSEKEFLAPSLILNAALTADQIPNHRVTMLDPKAFNSCVIDEELGNHTEEWFEIWRFALTFDGYRYFGNDDHAPERLNKFVKSVEMSFLENEEMPSIDLAMLRACLFQQQRFWCKWGGGMERDCPRETARFLDALLVGIREGLQS